MHVIALLPQRYAGKRYLRGELFETVNRQDALDLIALNMVKAAPPRVALPEGDNAEPEAKTTRRVKRNEDEA